MFGFSWNKTFYGIDTLRTCRTLQFMGELPGWQGLVLWSHRSGNADVQSVTGADKMLLARQEGYST